ncbi:shikimate dehydrogenase [bacterium]|nr:shikimate dehydrogenase [bacterium]
MITTALIGLPVDHSVSPILFNLYAKEFGLEYAHSKFNVKSEDLEKVIRSLPAFGFAGVNITLPYKSAVMPFLDSVSVEAKAIGAVNTVKVNNGKLEGYNTDAYGALRAIEKKLDKKVNQENVAFVFGTGGAARAIVWGLIKSGFKVKVVFRKPESNRTKDFKRDFIDKISFITYDELNTEDLEKSVLLCNATSAGMNPNENETPIDLDRFKKINLSGIVMFDAIFNPVTTKLQRWAKDNGAILAYGIDMMIYQGIVAFEYWTEKKVGEEVAQRAFNTLMKDK